MVSVHIVHIGCLWVSVGISGVVWGCLWAFWVGRPRHGAGIRGACGGGSLYQWVSRVSRGVVVPSLWSQVAPACTGGVSALMRSIMACICSRFIVLAPVWLKYAWRVSLSVCPYCCTPDWCNSLGPLGTTWWLWHPLVSLLFSSRCCNSRF
jgi:hypothetical protein